MTTKVCNVCHRTMALEQFRLFRKGYNAGRRQKRCRQCEAEDKIERRLRYRANLHTTYTPDPLNLAAAAWIRADRQLAA